MRKAVLTTVVPTKALLKQTVLWKRSLLAVAIITTTVLAVAGCSDNSEAPPPDDLDSWTVVPEFTLHHPEPTGRFQTPRWSPDGRHLAIDGSGGLYLAPFPMRGLPTRIIEESIHEFAWSPDSRHVAAIPIGDAMVIIYDVRTGLVRSRIRVPASRILGDLVWTTGGYLSVSAPEESRHFFFDVEGRAVPEYRIADPSCAWQRFLPGQEYEIWAIDRQHRQEQLIAGPGRWFLITSQSPRARKLVSYTDVVEKDIVISQLLDFTGLYLYAFPENFVDSDWTSDGRYVVGTEVTGDESEDAISGSELVIFDPETYQYSIITDTPNVIEWEPSLSVANMRIAYINDEGRVVIGRVVESDGETVKSPLLAP